VPYTNEHSCRLLDPKLFRTCRRTERTSDGHRYSILTCQRADNISVWQEQAFRYSIEQWNESEAKAHCNRHGGTFEAVTPETIKIDPESMSLVRKRNIIGTTQEPPGLMLEPITMQGLGIKLKGLFTGWHCYQHPEGAKFSFSERDWDGMNERRKFDVESQRDREQLEKSVCIVFHYKGERYTGSHYGYIPPHHEHKDLVVNLPAIRHSLAVAHGARGGWAGLTKVAGAKGYACVYVHLMRHCRDSKVIKFSDPKAAWEISEREIRDCQWWKQED